MLKNIYVVTKHSYWEHYGSKPTTTEYETKEEALNAANDYESRWFMEDGYYATVHTEKRLVITDQEESKRKMRQFWKQPSFDYKKDSYCYGIYTFWDGFKDIFFITMDPNGVKTIWFVRGKVKYTLATHIDYFRHNLKGKFCVGDNEKMTILGGLHWLPKTCQKIDIVEFEYMNDELPF